MTNRQTLSQEQYSIDLVSVGRNLNSESFRIESQEFGTGFPAGCSVEKRRLHGGKQEGVDLITIDNGKIKIRVIPTRGMGILDVVMGDIRLGWDSPVREVVHPAFINLQSRNGLGWLEGFNEWLVRCGLESAGAPGPDSFVNNQGDEARMDLTLHGKIANIPASEVRLLVDLRPPFAIRLRGKVEERMLFGPKLELGTELVVEPGASEFGLIDRVTNHGAHEQEFQLIYHINFGSPLLEEGAEFLGSIGKVFPLNQRAAEGLTEFGIYQGPRAGFVEQVYCMEPLGDADGKAGMLLRNRAGDRGAWLEYDQRNLPGFSLWKNLAATEEGYVTGFEPGTGFPFPRKVERRFGRVPKLAPGETKSFEFRFGLLPDGQSVKEAEARIQSIVQGRQLQVLPAAPDLPSHQ